MYSYSPCPGIHHEQALFFIKLSVHHQGCLTPLLQVGLVRCVIHVLQNLCLAGTGWEEQQALGAALMEIIAITISFLIRNNHALLPDGFSLGYHF